MLATSFQGVSAPASPGSALGSVPQSALQLFTPASHPLPFTLPHFHLATWLPASFSPTLHGAPAWMCTRPGSSKDAWGV